MIIEYCSELYPKILKEIENPPSRLYVIGNLENLNNIGISVIGSRTNSPYGERMCKKFVEQLVRYNVNIISGMAIGIDTISHKTCLENSGKTIAVLPSGFNKIYPSCNKKLFKEILENDGTIVSEYDYDVLADSKKFLERNRIVSGLGIGTLVVEAGYRSGTSVTARITENSGKPVFCIPSSLENPKGIMANELIKNGANLVTNVKDIFKHFNSIKFEERKDISHKNIKISDDLKNVYNVLNEYPLTINEIVEKTRINISDVNYKIMLLLLSDKILELPGQKYIRKDLYE